ncbi:hypothetical protein [Achromobacter xylosoxidans]|uniref:hypothetical protein n=1 Tax=Alcaligenes xylosoxydans xylosoxydans TaxID=85698 RepID=UPI001EEF1D13|nr:hypothetical protein [Achromobacter xylosoxidans]
MNNVTAEEALALLSSPLICEDCPDWVPGKELKGLLSTSCGLLDSTGRSAKLVAELRFRRSSKTHVAQYVFSVFRRTLPRGLERVYQLDILQWPKPVKDLHQMPHEHFGNERIQGDDSWSKWTYDEVLAHFCARANITFVPPVPHPEELRLKGQ